MGQNSLINVAILYGGQSSEHEVSLVSAYSVIKNIDFNKFNVIPIGIDQNGKWFLNDVQELLKNSDDKLSLHLPGAKEINSFSASNHVLNNNVDVVFPVLHGTKGEDGCIQGLLEIANLAYVGSKLLSSALAMDKDFTKKLVSGAGIEVVDSLTIYKRDFFQNPDNYTQQIVHELGLPVFIKPSKAGSSIGISKVTVKAKLATALMYAFKFDNKVLSEKAVDAQEVEVAVLENIKDSSDPLVSVAGEIRISKEYEFYSYDAKYNDHNLELVIPAEISESELDKMQQIAREIFLLLDCSGMARVDFFVEKATRRIIFNELNTIPGFTPVSMYPLLWADSGINYSALITHLIELALRREDLLHLD